MDRKKLGEKIKQLRVLKSISQTDMAKALNVTQSSISAYEKGIVDQMPKLPDIAKYLDVTVSSLLDEIHMLKESTLPYNAPPNAIPLNQSDYIYIPVFARIPCSLPDYAC